MAAVYIAGATGRVGREVARLVAAAGLTQVDAPGKATIWMLALPRTVVDAELAHWTAPRSAAVIDLSGAFKARGVGTYALLADPAHVWAGEPVSAHRLFANAGCIASAVIVGLTQSGLARHVTGGLHVTAVTAGSAAGATTAGTLRPGHRWWDHPHVAEIERAVGHPCASFVPLVDYGLARGIVATVSGTAAAAARTLPAAVGDEVDVAQVQQTAEVRWHRRVREHVTLGRMFTLTVALDNLTFPAANAVAVARQWLAAQEPA